MSSKNLFLGISFDNDVIRFIEFEKTTTKNIITNMGEKLLPENSCVNQYDIFVQDVVEKHIKEMIKEYRIRAEKVIYFIPDERVLKRKIKLPASSTDNEIHARIKQRSKQILEEPIDHIYFDFSTQLNKEENKLDVSIWAVKRTSINIIDETLKKSGLEPLVADVPSLSMNRVNDYIRMRFEKKQKTKLAFDEFLIYLINTPHHYNVMFYSGEGELHGFQHNKNEQSTTKDVVDEAFHIVKENNIEQNFAGVVLLNVSEQEQSDSGIEWPVLMFDLNAEFKSKVKHPPSLTQQWLEILGIALRKTNFY